MPDELTITLVEECRRRLLEESVPRLRRCLGMLSDEQLWQRPAGVCNSPGNLTLHLCGNVDQWVNHALGGRPDHRTRDAEFDPDNQCPRDELLQRLDEMADRASRTLTAILEKNVDLTAEQRVQGFDETGVAILIHVVEHFSYHVGQVTLMTKMWTGIETNYYSGQDLDTTGSA